MSVDFTLNGEPCNLPKGSLVKDLVKELELGELPLTIKVNGKRLMRHDWKQEILAEDVVEINQAIPHSCVTIHV